MRNTKHVMTVPFTWGQPFYLPTKNVTNCEKSICLTPAGTQICLGFRGRGMITCDGRKVKLLLPQGVWPRSLRQREARLARGLCARFRGERSGFEPWPRTLCSWARHFTLTVPLSTRVCKWATSFPGSLILPPRAVR